jgi:acetoin utilization protein AcuC
MLPRHDADMVKRGSGRSTDGPLLVFGPRSTTYDFGPSHPLTPRRFGPGIDLLRSLGAEPGLAPEPAPDEDLLLCHTADYVAAVRRLSADPLAPPEAGIGPAGDNPSFAGMHDAGAMVAGGSMRAMDAILRGDVEHAFHPGGGLHHAMPSRASGFCIYDDPALAIALARRAGLRVLYIDLDVHHGDGVEAIHSADPGVMTVSFHESGNYLFPGSGFPNEHGEGVAAGTAINVPFEPFTGADAWLRAVANLVPALAASFGPDIVVSQHGCDSHAWDPLAHLRVTTTAMGAAARLVDRIAHRWASGGWLATGGGGYDAYRVVPRAWAHVWLAGAHRDPPPETAQAWRDRWQSEAARYGQAPLPVSLDDDPNGGLAFDERQRAAEQRSSSVADAVGSVLVPAIVREAIEHGWLDPLAEPSGSSQATTPEATTPEATTPAADGPTPSVTVLSAHGIEGLTLAPRVIALADPVAGHAVIRAALVDAPGRAPRPCVVGAVVGHTIVGVAIAAAGESESRSRLVALGVAPAYRRRGLATGLLAGLVAAVGAPIDAAVTVAERDPHEPLNRALRATVARRLLERAGFRLTRPEDSVRAIDPEALAASTG